MPVRPETQRREEDVFDEPLNGARAVQAAAGATWFVPDEVRQSKVEA